MHFILFTGQNNGRGDFSVQNNTNNDKLKDDLQQNTLNIKKIMRSSTDLIMKNAKICGNKVCIVMCEGMASTSTTAQLVYQPLNLLNESKKELSLEETVNLVENEVFLAAEQKPVTTYDELIKAIMSGFVVILFDGLSYGTSIGIQGYATRSIEEPSTRQNIRSAHEGFVEVVRTNVSLIRRRMKTPDLVMKIQSVGGLSKTDVCICYIESKADPKLVKDIQKKIDSIPLDMILESGYIQPFLEEKGNILFSEVGVTDHPDDFIAKLYDGRIGIIVDGTPFAIFLPYLFTENFTAMDDYSGVPVYAAMMRLLRYFAYFASIFIPGMYVALANFNPELFPDSLLLNLSASIQTTPYPILPECLVIHIFYEIMREAGLRMPKNVGHAVSIVGGLVIGDIVVSAGLVGAPLVLIVALSAITSFVVPDLYESIAVMRFVYIIAGGMWGLYGITVVGILFLLKLCSLNAFGIPHTAPLSPFSFKAMRDIFIRASWRILARRDVKIQDLKGVDIKDD